MNEKLLVGLSEEAGVGIKKKKIYGFIMDKVIVEDWLKFYSIKNYTINEDLSVDVID